MFDMLVAAIIIFIVIPIILNKTLGWRGKKAQYGLVVIAALYWIYIWYAD